MRAARPPKLVLAAVCLIVGIMLGRAAGDWLPPAVLLGLGLVGCALLHGRRGFLAAVLVCVCAVGGLRGYAAWHPAVPAAGEYTVCGTVAQSFTLGEKGQNRTVLKAITLDGKAVSGQAYWSFYTAVPEEAEAGSRVTFTGKVYLPGGAENPGGFDFREYLLQRGMQFGLFGAADATVSPGGFDLMVLAARCRDALTAKLCEVMGEASGAYAAAMLLGDKSLLPDAERDAFNRLGAAHILAVSGFHVGLLAFALRWLLRRLRVGRAWELAVLTCVLGAYCMLTGLSASAMRAALLVLLAGLGRLARRRTDLPTLLAASAILLLLWQPAQLTAAGFQMTYLAMLGLAYITPYLEKRLSPRTKAGRYTWKSVSASAGVQAALIGPLTWWYQRLPVLGIFVNIGLLFYAALLMYTYLATCVLMWLPFVGNLMGAAASGLTQALVKSVTWLSQFSFVSLWTTQGSALTWLLTIPLAAALCLRVRWKKPWLRAVVGSLAAAGIALTLIPWPHTGVDYLQLSVGNADAAVLRDENYTCVIDTGGDSTLATYLRQRRLSVDLLVVTHLHMDHAAGIQALLDEDIPVKECLLPFGADTLDITPEMKALVDALAQRGTKVSYTGRGDVRPLPSGTFTVLWPEKDRVRPGLDANCFSLTARVEVHGVSLLLTGDLDGAYELYAAAPADILKAAHHGSAGSTGADFLRQVAPQTILLSGDDEARYQSLTERAKGAAIYATQHGGALNVHILDGGYTVSTFIKERETDGS